MAVIALTTIHNSFGKDGSVLLDYTKPLTTQISMQIKMSFFFQKNEDEK